MTVPANWPLHTAASLAREFSDLAFFSLEHPRPERLEDLRKELMVALEALGQKTDAE